MPTYISLCRWTIQGASKVKESPVRLDVAKKALAADGVKLLNFYMVMGSHDLVIVCEAAKVAPRVRRLSQGGITTETSRAFTEDEYRKIIGSL